MAIGWLHPVKAQAINLVTPTLDSTITALERRVFELEASDKVANEQNAADKQSVENEIQKGLLPVYIVGIIFAALGISSAVGVWIWIRNFIKKTKTQVEMEMREKLDQAFYNADPLYFPIYVPNDDQFKIERKRLKKLGFRDLRPYGGLSEGILDGIVIIRIPGNNFGEKEDCIQAESALKSLEDFMLKHNTESKKVAFVLYISGSGRLPMANHFASKYDNMVIANMPVTIAEHIYALVRGLTMPEIKLEEDK
jgi:hypothetical protein